MVDDQNRPAAPMTPRERELPELSEYIPTAVLDEIQRVLVGEFGRDRGQELLRAMDDAVRAAIPHTRRDWTRQVVLALSRSRRWTTSENTGHAGGEE